FLQRGIEACVPQCRGCVVLADDDSLPWTQEVLGAVQQSVVAGGFMISELKPKAHQYHLDDAPELSSCTMLLKRDSAGGGSGRSLQLAKADCENFYGKGLPLTVRMIRDRTAAGRFPSRDYVIEPFEPTLPLWE